MFISLPSSMDPWLYGKLKYLYFLPLSIAPFSSIFYLSTYQLANNSQLIPIVLSPKTKQNKTKLVLSGLLTWLGSAQCCLAKRIWNSVFQLLQRALPSNPSWLINFLYSYCYFSCTLTSLAASVYFYNIFAEVSTTDLNFLLCFFVQEQKKDFWFLVPHIRSLEITTPF